MGLFTLRFFSKHQNSYKVCAQILKSKRCYILSKKAEN